MCYLWQYMAAQHILFTDLAAELTCTRSVLTLVLLVLGHSRESSPLVFPPESPVLLGVPASLLPRGQQGTLAGRRGEPHAVFVPRDGMRVISHPSHPQGYTTSAPSYRICIRLRGESSHWSPGLAPILE